MQSTVTSKGQVTIPSKLRKDLGISTGSRLDFHVGEDGKIEVQVLSGRLTDLQSLLPQPKKVLTVDEMNKVISASK